MLCRRIRGNNAGAFKILAFAVSEALMLATVIGRALCGVHYLTDIIGGLLLSAAIIALFAAFLPAQNAEKTVNCKAGAATND